MQPNDHYGTRAKPNDHYGSQAKPQSNIAGTRKHTPRFLCQYCVFFIFLHIIIVFTFYMSFCKYIIGKFPSPMLGRLKNLIMSHYLTSSNSIHRFTTMFAQTAFHGTAAHTHFSAIANPVKLFQNSKTTMF